MQNRTLEKLALKGEMLPVPGLITMYMLSAGNLHLAERALRQRMSSVLGTIGSIDITSIGGSGEQQEKRSGDSKSSPLQSQDANLQSQFQAMKNLLAQKEKELQEAIWQKDREAFEREALRKENEELKRTIIKRDEIIIKLNTGLKK